MLEIKGGSRIVATICLLGSVGLVAFLLGMRGTEAFHSWFGWFFTAFMGAFALFWIWMFIRNPKYRLRIDREKISWLDELNRMEGEVELKNIRKVHVKQSIGYCGTFTHIHLVLENGERMELGPNCYGNWSDICYHLSLHRPELTVEVQTSREGVPSPPAGAERSKEA